jgi:hypothetical protein
MVPRTALVAALAEARSGNDAAQAKAGELASLENLLRRAEERLAASEVELNVLKETLAGSVPRSELVAAEAKSEKEDARAQVALGELREKSSEWQAEASQLRTALQVAPLTQGSAQVPSTLWLTRDPRRRLCLGPSTWMPGEPAA